jgi:hypothetical protein
MARKNRPPNTVQEAYEARVAELAAQRKAMIDQFRIAPAKPVLPAPEPEDADG